MSNHVSTIPETQSFTHLNLASSLIAALKELGYENATAIQQQCIPILLSGRDLIGQAQTGTGKTAAFALPILNQLDLKLNKPQALILTPTRELAIQVAEAFHSYSKFLPNFQVLPIYGGQDYSPQLRALKRGAHVVVGTPGRVMDHLRRKTLQTESLKTLILDEADEMLKMGFIEDVQWVLTQIKQAHQIGLFSATMPEAIRRIAKQHLKNAEHITIEPSQRTATGVLQQYALVPKDYKLDALTRFLEMDEFDAAIIFTRTKIASVDLAEKLQARGYAVSAINGDIPQRAREQIIQKFRNGTLDLIVATEVAARGLDISRIDFVINYDIPSEVESYVHRIGRTGRAGRQGRALVLVTPRERHMLGVIERVTNQRLQQVIIPSLSSLKIKQQTQIKDTLLQLLNKKIPQAQSESIDALIAELKHNNHSTEDIAATLIAWFQEQQSDFNSFEDNGLDHALKQETGAQEQKFQARPRRRSANPPPLYKKSDARRHYNSREKKRRSKHR